MNTIIFKKKIDLIFKIVLIGLSLSFFYHLLFHILGFEYPKSTFLFNPKDRFGDFLNLYKLFKNSFNPYNSNYINPHFPFGTLVEFLFCKLGGRDLSLYLFFLINIFFIYRFSRLMFLDKKVSKNDMFKYFFVLFFSYPFIFTIDRANFEITVFVFIIFFYYFYYISIKPNLAVLFLSCAISMKLFPVLLVLLIIKRKDWISLVKTFILSLILTFSALLIMDGGIFKNIELFLNNQERYFSLYIKGTEALQAGLAFSHSIFGLIRLFSLKFNFYFQNFNKIIFSYNIFVFIYSILISFYIVALEEETWKQLALIIFTFNLLPYTSADYKMIHILLPFSLFVLNDGEVHKTYSILFSLLFIPKAYYVFDWIKSDSGFADISISNVINSLLMLFFSLVIIVEVIKRQYEKNKFNFLYYKPK